jgi:hypothetical protein
MDSIAWISAACAFLAAFHLFERPSADGTKKHALLGNNVAARTICITRGAPTLLSSPALNGNKPTGSARWGTSFSPPPHAQACKKNAPQKILLTKTEQIPYNSFGRPNSVFVSFSVFRGHLSSSREQGENHAIIHPHAHRLHPLRPPSPNPPPTHLHPPNDQSPVPNDQPRVGGNEPDALEGKTHFSPPEPDALAGKTPHFPKNPSNPRAKLQKYHAHSPITLHRHLTPITISPPPS